MSQLGALYVDVGLRGLSQATAGLRGLGERLATAGQQARGLASGSLGRIGGVLGGVGKKIAGLAGGLGLAQAGMIGVAAGGLIMMTQLGKVEGAGEGLVAVTAAFDGLKQSVMNIVLEFGELIARQTGLAGGLDSVTAALTALWENWKPTVAAMIELAVTTTSNIMSAFGWLFDTMTAGLNAFFELFGVSLTGGSQTWAETIKDWADTIQFFFETFTLRLELAWERLKLWASNSIEQVKAFAQNAVILVEWVWDNFSDIFETIGNYIVTVFSNAGDNLKAIWDSVVAWVSGSTFELDLKPLTEGFKSTIKAMPQFVEAATRDSNERLDALMGEMNRKREQFQAKVAARDAMAMGRLRTDAKAQQAAVAGGPQYGMVGFSELARKSQDDTLKKLQERAAAAGERAAIGIQGLAEAANGRGLRVRMVGEGGGARFD